MPLTRIRVVLAASIALVLFAVIILLATTQSSVERAGRVAPALDPQRQAGNLPDLAKPSSVDSSSAAEKARSVVSRAMDAGITLHALFSLQKGRDLLREISKLPASGDLVELKNATLLACLTAVSEAMKSRYVQGPGANREAIRAFAEGYCADIQRGSSEVANAEARSDMDAAALNGDSEIGRANALSERIDSQDVPDAALVQKWQDALLNAKNPMAARALAHFATDEAGPMRAVIGDDALGNWPTERGAAISEAMGAIIACQNGPMCAPGTAYTMIACMERGNVAAGATLLDVRRDSISPQDWRSAELIVARLHARRRGP